LPLATNEIKKLHHWNLYLKADAANVFWSIPLDDESRRMTAFQTHEGIFAWDRLTMGTKLASTVPYGTKTLQQVVTPMIGRK
jgi:L-rhamnose mutarotase